MSCLPDNDTARYLRRAALAWCGLIIIFNLVLFAIHVYYHEDFLGHIYRHWRFLTMLAIAIHGLIGMGFLIETWLFLYNKISSLHARWLLRLSYFIPILLFFAWWLNAFYINHPTPHVPGYH